MLTLKIKPILAELNQLKKTTAKNVPGGAKATGPLPKNKTLATKKGKGKKERMCERYRYR
jgi:hypothetical protein